jgi:hypothetical protein
MRALPPFAEQRLITEGVIHVSAVVCTILVLLGPRPTGWPDRPDRPFTDRGLAWTAAGGLAALGVAVAVAAAGTRAVHGDVFVGHGGYHVRFGPNAKTGKPKPGAAHP